MILICSAGHEWNPEGNLWHRDLGRKVGGKCSALLSYDRMSGSTYCQRRLNLKPLTFGNQEEDE